MEFNKKEYLNSFIGEDGIDIFNPIACIKATLPKKFYKFYPLENENDDRTLKTLSEGKAWFGNISTMNDPFEFEKLNILEEELLEDIKKMEGRTEYQEIYEMLKERKLELLEVYNKLLNDVIKKGLEIFCVSKNFSTNNSMWAYYANNHKGFILKFELLEKKLESLQNLKPVLYEEKLSKQSYLFMKKLKEVYCELLVEKNSKEFNQKFFGMTQLIYFFCSCKDKSWENEEEYRFFKFSTADKGELVNFFDANLKLVSIYGGINISEKNVEKLKSIANKLGVDFKTTKISNKEYKIEES